MHNTRRGEVLEAGMRITGPNDAFRVVWAIGTCFFFFLRSFYILIIISCIHRLLYTYYTTWRGTGGSDDEKWPKRLGMSRLGTR